MGNGDTLYEPEEAIEAGDVESMLLEEGIPCSVLRKQDTAYPGIADAGAGWGAILVGEEDLELAQERLADFLEAEIDAPALGPYREGSAEDEIGATSGEPYETLAERTRKGVRWVVQLGSKAAARGHTPPFRPLGAAPTYGPPRVETLVLSEGYADVRARKNR